MQFQATLRHPSVQRVPYGPRLLLGPAVHQPVIRVRTPSQVRKSPRHPKIKRVVQEKIGQDRDDHSPNAKGNFCFDRVTPLDRSQGVLDLRRKR